MTTMRAKGRWTSTWGENWWRLNGSYGFLINDKTYLILLNPLCWGTLSLSKNPNNRDTAFNVWWRLTIPHKRVHQSKYYNPVTKLWQSVIFISPFSLSPPASVSHLLSDFYPNFHLFSLSFFFFALPLYHFCPLQVFSLSSSVPLHTLFS